jgi:hypothetical protein
MRETRRTSVWDRRKEQHFFGPYTRVSRARGWTRFLLAVFMFFVVIVGAYNV